MSVVERGHSLVLSFNGGDQYFFVYDVKEGKKLKVGKKASLSPSELLGLPYGALFRLEGGRLLRIRERPRVTLARAARVAGEDNRSLLQDHSAQSLTQGDIEALKAGSEGGAAIIQKLVDNSASWAGKTSFSQQKWLAKKTKKYLGYYQVLRPCASSIVASLSGRNHSKINYVRSDSLATILLQADLRSSVLVAEHSGGLITGAVVRRLGSSGRVVSVDRRAPSLPVMRLYNLSEGERSRVTPMSWKELLDARGEQDFALFHSAIVSVDHDPQQVARLATEMLELAGQLVVHSVSVAALQPLMVWCARQDAPLVRYSVCETFTRTVQVEPKRTHPLMRMHNASGFVFVATKVDKSAARKAESEAQGKEGGVQEEGEEEEDGEDAQEPPAKIADTKDE